MSDIIHLLSDAIANQIAAGEVIQRPSSVLKELVENAVDADAKMIRIRIKQAGRSLIQVIDNGNGMSETDARMAFERHATSKIKSADDLFAIRTMGFRGEALASIVAVAQVELKTRRMQDEMGTYLSLSASQLEKQEAVATNVGSVFSVKNLFFNIPARRKFLKSNETELKNILTEFQRIVLVNPEIGFELAHNDTVIYHLPPSGLRQRIVNVFGKSLNRFLLPLQVETSLVKLSGFVGTPVSSKKRGAQQFFFVNGRFMKHAYFHKAVTTAFEPFIPTGDVPNYFIYMEVDPATIDVNIHPTKTEIKFENEQAIWQILLAAVKESIGKSGAVPGLDFEQERMIDIPAYHQGAHPATPPQVTINKDYNPFSVTRSGYDRGASSHWEQFFEKQKPDNSLSQDAAQAFDSAEDPQQRLMDCDLQAVQYKNKYLIALLKSGLFLIDQRRAHIRVLFDEYAEKIKNRQSISQQLLFPEIVSFTPQEAIILPFLLEDFAAMGFDLSNLGNNSYSINGAPAGLENVEMADFLKDMVSKAMETGCEIKEEMTEATILSLAKKVAIPYGKPLSTEEINRLTASLFASASPNYTPDGKVIIVVINDEEMEKRFLKS
ncbi:MAG: DNA mismatch repair endonuclease MutL [Dysgonamonadaceae bacterium]|jgi:DNA mismatch repair protein MutL|nr:DNA mismatch repair endonuclease MutL [Dysgonamonadaceae bacterium]